MGVRTAQAAPSALGLSVTPPHFGFPVLHMDVFEPDDPIVHLRAYKVWKDAMDVIRARLRQRGWTEDTGRIASYLCSDCAIMSREFRWYLEGFPLLFHNNDYDTPPPVINRGLFEMDFQNIRKEHFASGHAVTSISSCVLRLTLEWRAFAVHSVRVRGEVLHVGVTYLD